MERVRVSRKCLSVTSGLSLFKKSVCAVGRVRARALEIQKCLSVTSALKLCFKSVCVLSVVNEPRRTIKKC